MKRHLIILMLCALGVFLSACASPMSSNSPARLPPPSAAPGSPKEASLAQGTGRQAQDALAAQSADRMIVYTVQLGLQVQDTDAAVGNITAIAAQFKGYVAGTNLSRDPKGRMRGTITLRIPAASLDAAQTQIEAAGLKVLNRNRSSNDVTDQYSDLDARVKNLTATEDELRSLLNTVREKTGKAEDILAVYNRLSEIRGQIEQLKGQMNVLSKTSALATITVDLVPYEPVSVLEPDTWLPDRTAREALRALVSALQALATLTIWIILFFAPLLLVVLLPFVLLALLLRAIVRRRTQVKPVPTS